MDAVSNNPALDAEDLIGVDVICIACAYNLRGLSRDSSCPECGAAIARSLHGDWLRYADARWTRTVQRGLRLVASSLIALFIAIIALFFVIMFHLLAPNAGFALVKDGAGYLLSFLVSAMLIAIPAALVIGLWLATTPEPRELNSGGLRRVALRVLSLLVVPAIALWQASDVWLFTSALEAWLHLIISLVGVFIVLAHMTMFNDLLRSLEDRCLDRDEKRRKLLSKYRKHGLGLAVAILASVAVVTARAGALPLAGLGIVILIWIAILSFARGTARRMAAEMRAVEGDHS